jgi:hypothetical protein
MRKEVAMKRTGLLLLGWLASGCGEPVGGGAAQPEERAAPQGRQEGCEICARDAQYDFQVTGARVAAWEGKRVTAVVFENYLPAGVLDPASEIHARTVRLSTRIRDGAFSLSCPRSVRESAYPSVALFVDVDGDGRCTGADSGYQVELYGWGWPFLEGSTVTVSVPDSQLGLDWSPIAAGGLQPPIGSGAADFCSGYFE